jgi:hypothetical protein
MKKALLVLLSFLMTSMVFAQLDLITPYADRGGDVRNTRLNGVLYDQISGYSGVGVVTSQVFDNANVFGNQNWTDKTTYCADDFEVPMGFSWTITSVEVLGAYFIDGNANPSTDGTAFNVYFYADNGGQVGPQVAAFEGVGFSQNVPTDAAEFSFDISLGGGVFLTAGRYWMSAQMIMDPCEPGDGSGNCLSGATAFRGQWGWRQINSATPSGNQESKFQNPLAGFLPGLICADCNNVTVNGDCYNWSNRYTCCGVGKVVSAGCSDPTGGPYLDLAFALGGTSRVEVTVPTMSEWATLALIALLIGAGLLMFRKNV